MNEVRLNIIDARGGVNGIVHCGLAEGAIAALSAEPETIKELEGAIERFIRRDSERGAFNSFTPGEDFNQWDQGTVIIDLAARIVATKSLYCTLPWRGDVEYYKGGQAAGVWLPYCIPEDWLLLHSTENGVEVRDALTEYTANRDKRRAERAANEPIDARDVLYGAAMIRFVADACTAAKNRRAAEGFSESSTEDATLHSRLSPSATRLMRLIHGRWLMTPRADLGGRTPREVIIEKLFFIDSDSLAREIQWSLLGEAAAPIARDSHAYRFAGFGTHEYVVYYHLLRHLLSECLTRLKRDREPEAPSLSAVQYSSSGGAVDQSSPSEPLVTWLESIKEAWLNVPNEFFGGRIPSAIVETERRRIPLPMSEEEAMLREDIPDEIVERFITKIRIATSEIRESSTSYRLMHETAGEDLGPEFKYLDTADDNEGFIFSTCSTREEWNAIEINRREIDDKYEQFRESTQDTTPEEPDEQDDGGSRVH